MKTSNVSNAMIPVFHFYKSGFSFTAATSGDQVAYLWRMVELQGQAIRLLVDEIAELKSEK
jgi:hypothetical protein